MHQQALLIDIPLFHEIYFKLSTVYQTCFSFSHLSFSFSMYNFLSTKQNGVSALLMLPGYEAGRSQALVKAEGEVTLKETCQLLRLSIDLVKSIYLYMEIV